VIAVLGVETLCAGLRLDQKIDWCQRVLALMHAFAGSGDTMEAWAHMLYAIAPVI
jgi:hypothetical protein